MTIISKEDAARQILEVRAQIIENSRTFNQEDAVLILLSLDEAFDNLRNTVALHFTSGSNDDSPTEKAMIFRDLHQWMVVIDMALEAVLSYGSVGSGQLTHTPLISVSMAPSIDSFVQALIASRSYSPRDAFIPLTVRLSGQREMSLIIRIQDGKETVQETLSSELVSFLFLISKYHILGNAVRLDLSLTIRPGQDVPWINYPSSMTPDKIMSRDMTNARTLFGSTIAADWSSDFLETTEKGIKTIVSGRNSHSNRVARQAENRELFRGYLSFPGFDQSFRKYFGFSVNEFEKVTWALEELARPRAQSVFHDSYKKLLSSTSRSAGVPKPVSEKILLSLLWKPGRSLKQSPVIQQGIRADFSMFRVMRAVMGRLEAFFEFVYDDTNMKGELFEKACRKEIAYNGFSVHPERLEVAEQVVGDRESIELWGRVKKATDFDVIGCKGQYLLVIECKELKGSKLHLRVHLRNLFGKYHRELELKTLWLSRNVQRLAGSPCWKNLSNTQPRFILALIVCNQYVYDLDANVPFLAFREFSHFLEKFDFRQATAGQDSIRIPAATGSDLQVRCFEFEVNS